MMQRHAFTLVETLVVAAIIAILALILLPTFQRSGDNAKRASCQSNLKQLGLGLLQYAGDYGNRLPNQNGGGKAYGWADTLLPYTKESALLQCPSERTPRTAKTALNPRRANYTDYWFNQRLSSRTLETIATPSRTVMLGEGNDGTDRTNARYSSGCIPQTWFDSPTSPLVRHDGGRFDALWVDGHVKSLTPDKIESTSASRNGFAF